MAERLQRTAGHRVHKRIISDQQKRRDIALERQNQSRRDLQNHARQVASLFVPPASSPAYEQQDDIRFFQEDQNTATDDLQFQDHNEAYADYIEQDDFQQNEEYTADRHDGVANILQATRLKGSKARDWFKHQLMLPEWMVDIPSRLSKDWYVSARPAGERCIVVSSNGTTVSRMRNGRTLHCFPSALPNGSRAWGSSSQVFCILDCIFHKRDNTYYIIDMMCWRGYPLYDCNYEFRQFWIQSKLEETGAFNAPSTNHRYRFSTVPAYECNVSGLQAAYGGPVPFERDGCLFFNRHAHYVLGVTPLALLWKDSVCSRYYIDTDSKGNVPTYQQVVLELQEDGTVATCDDPKVVLGSLPEEFIFKQDGERLKPGTLVKFSIGDQGLSVVNGKPVAADIQYQGVANRFRAGADSVSKVLFQYAARHSPVTITDIVTAIESPDDDDFEMGD